ncbi:MAG: family 16 glycosylhydrolase [Bacteroidetes bacterium]|nr:family 16 glycosylhydrolase [Bacteroidota bacterium]
MKKFVLLFMIQLACLQNGKAQQNVFGEYLNWVLTDRIFYLYFVDENKVEFTTSPPCPDAHQWQLVFEDDFETEGYLDPDVWYVHSGDEGVYWSPENVTVEGGKLKLWETAIPNPGGQYSQGMVSLKQQYRYGKFEISCKIPKGRSSWPAFWLQAGHLPESYYNEIDIFEIYDQYDDHVLDESSINKRHSMTLFYPFPDISLAETQGYDGPDFSEKFHTFTLEWDPFTIIIRMDGDLKWRYHRFENWLGFPVSCLGMEPNRKYHIRNSFPVDQQNVILNSSIDVRPDVLPPLLSELPRAFEIEYIKIWDRLNVAKNVDKCDFSLADNHTSVITGRTITLGGNTDCSTIVHEPTTERFHGECLTLVATDEISLKPGFSVEKGGHFTAKIASYEKGMNSTSSIDENEDSLIQRTPLYENSVISEYLSEDSLSNSYEVYPNPNAGSFTVVLNSSANEFNGLAIINLNGNIIKQIESVSENKVNIDISNQPPGTYFLVIMVNKKGYMNKIIKQ